MRALILGIAVVAAGCLPKTEYKCTVNGDCTASGSVCEPSGYCSFVDDKCASGHRYGELSGPVANQCVGGGDGGIEIDALIVACPATYTTMIGTHSYRVITTTAIWSAQRAACAADATNAYLAIPDDQAELTAIRMAGGATQVWIGIDDQTTEGTYATVRGGTLAMTSPLWNTGEPNDNPLVGQGPGDCLVAVDTNGNRVADDRCDRTYVAVCECEP
jgi:hypothetical protein